MRSVYAVLLLAAAFAAGYLAGNRSTPASRIRATSPAPSGGWSAYPQASSEASSLPAAAASRQAWAEAAPAAGARVAQVADRVFELRTYTASEGRLDALHQRFRDHTTRIFEKHGITSIGYWVPQDPERSDHTLIYLLAHPSREAAEESWAAFRDDPEWQQVARESERDGRIVQQVESVFMDPTEYSELR